MKTITLKDMPQSVHTALKQRARRNNRSLNREVLACLEMIVTPAQIDADALLADIRKHREGLPGKLDDDLIERATVEGRP